MRVNASQVHEARMIATHVYKLVKRFEKKPKGGVFSSPLTEMMCAPCLRRDVRSKAVTIFNGNAVCITHVLMR